MREVHNVSVLDVGGRHEVSLHLKLPGELTLEEAHEVANQVETRDRSQPCPRSTSVQTHIEPLAEASEGARWSRTTAERDVVLRIVHDVTGLEPRELRFVRTDDGLDRLPDARPRRREPARRSACACERDRGANPPRASRHRRRDRAHGAVGVKLCMFTPRDLQLERGWPGIVEGDTVVQLAAQTLAGVLHRRRQRARARRVSRSPTSTSARPCCTRRRSATSTPSSSTSRRRARSRGQEVPPEWYELPVFYFSNPAAIYGPEDEIPYPPDTNELDYELEVAAIIGADGRIGGFTIMNDWSARDLQRAEMKVGLGPAKGKDFATSIGPVLVTPDEFDGAERDDGRARERRGALAREPRATCTTRGTRSSRTRRGTRTSGPETCSAPGRSGRAASSSTATAAGCKPATSSSSRSRESACCGTACGPRCG